MAIKNALAGVAVFDLDTAIGWYARLLGREADERPMTELVEYSFPGGGWLQIFQNHHRCGQSSVTLAVDSLEEQLGKLDAEGIGHTERTQSDYVDTATVIDPDGNRIVFAEAKSSANKAAS